MPPKPQDKAPVFDIEKILNFLPHRYPFLLVDRVLEMKKGKSLVALKNVSFNEEFFQGHFPRLRVMPGVLIIEAMAQAGCILIYNSIKNPKGKLLLFSKIDNARFRKPVVPGDQLRLEVEIIRLKSRTSQVRGRAFVDGEIVTEAEVLATIVDINNPAERE